MKTGRIQTIVLMAALVGCSSSSDDDSDKLPADPPQTMPDMRSPVTPGDKPTIPTDPAKPPVTDPGGPPAVTAGAGAPDPNEMEPMTDPMTDPMVDDFEFPDLRGVGCSVDSGFPGDEACLAPPPEGEGMQLHFGPTAYDQATMAPFIFAAQSESSECFTINTPNKEEIYYQGSVLSARPGTHHVINTAFTAEAALTAGVYSICASGFGAATATQIGAIPGASKAYMARRPAAPENKGLGRPLPVGAFVQADEHYFNFTDKPILREFWLNLYFIKKELVTETPLQIRGMGGFDWSRTPIAPGTDKVYQYSAPITADGRIVDLLGHYHAHGKRFTAYLKRANGDQLKVFEMYDYKDPLVYDYNSVTKNPPFSSNAGGAFTGRLEVKAGDALQWECHIINDGTVGLRYTNMVNTGEMCNLWGSSVGPKIDALLSAEVPFEKTAQ